MSNFNIFRVAGKAALLAFLVAFAITVVFPSHASAQSLIAGDIAGRVTDPSGAVVPNAVIDLKSLDTGVTASTNTSSEGLFRFSSPALRGEMDGSTGGTRRTLSLPAQAGTKWLDHLGMGH